MSAARAQARVNVAAIERNCARLRSELRDGVALCAVVKADGYGHGAAAERARGARRRRELAGGRRRAGGASSCATAGVREGARAGHGRPHPG